jgi:RNA-directed DNA polymerase
MHTLVRRLLPGWHIRAGGIELFRPSAFPIERYLGVVTLSGPG